MKKNLENKKGITLITLVVAVSIMIIISGLLIYNARTGIKVRNFNMMKNDIDLLDDKVNAYYVKYGALPVEIKYNVSPLPFESVKNPNDSTDSYYVLDLKAFEGLTLNYGADYDKLTEDTVAEYNDYYVINEQSHQIYYVRGIEMDGVMYYTNSIDDEVSLIPVEKENIWKIYILDENGNQILGKSLIRIYKDEELTDMVKQVVIRNGYYDGSDDIPSVGTYYVEIVFVPEGYDVAENVIKLDINNKKMGVWKIEAFEPEFSFLPSSWLYFEMYMNPYSYDENVAIDWEQNVIMTIKNNAIFQNINVPITFYKIGYYDAEQDKYFYTEEFMDIANLMELADIAKIMEDTYSGNVTNAQKQQVENWNDDLYDYIFENSNLEYTSVECSPNSEEELELERNGIYLYVLGEIEEISCVYTEKYEYYTGEYLFFAPLLVQGGTYDNPYGGAKPILRKTNIELTTVITDYNSNIGEETIVYRIDNYVNDSKEELYLSRIVTQKFTQNDLSVLSKTVGKLFPRLYRNNNVIFWAIL